MTLSALPDNLPPPPWDFLAGPEKDELSLTVRLSRGQNPTNPESLKITTNYDFSCCTSLPWQPPPPMRFSHWPWQSWTVLDSEIFSWQKYFLKYHKLWLCLLCLITLTPPPPWDFLADPEKHELSLTVRLSRGQNPINLEKLDLSFTFLIVQRFTIPDSFPGGWGGGWGDRPFVAGCFTNPEKLRIT